MKRFDMARTKFMLSIVLIFSVMVSGPCIFLYGISCTSVDSDQSVSEGQCGRIYKRQSMYIYHLIYDIVVITVGISGITLMSIFYALVGRVIIRQINFRKTLQVQQKYCQKQKKDTKENLGNAEVSNTVSGVSSSRTNPSNQSSDVTTGQLLSTTHEEENENKSQIKETINKYRFSLMFCIISFVFALSYTPRVYVMIRELINISFWDQISPLEFRISLFLYRMYIINNVSNFFLYLIFDLRFRKEVKNLFRFQR